MNRLLKLAAPLALAAGGFYAWRWFQSRRPAAKVPVLPTDDLLTRRVLVSMKQAGAVPNDLHMRVLDGTVILAGRVNATERDRVLRAILAVPGIRGVRNELDVEGIPRDPDLAAESEPWEASPRPR